MSPPSKEPYDHSRTKKTILLHIYILVFGYGLSGLFRVASHEFKKYVSGMENDRVKRKLGWKLGLWRGREHWDFRKDAILLILEAVKVSGAGKDRRTRFWVLGLTAPGFSGIRQVGVDFGA